MGLKWRLADLNRDLHQISLWGNRRKTTFEPLKCKFMTLSRKMDLLFDGHRLTTTNQLDILGATIDHKLSWSKHLTKISIRAGQKLAAPRRVASELTAESRATVYKLRVRSVVDSASLSWMCPPPSHLGLLDNIQRKALKMTGVDQDTASRTLSINSLSHRRQVAAATVPPPPPNAPGTSRTCC